MTEQDPADTPFNAMTERLLRREALRRAAEELNTTSGAGLEGVLARISAEVTAQAASLIPVEKTLGSDAPAPSQSKPRPSDSGGSSSA